MTVEPEFTTVEAADSAFFGSGDGSDDAGDGDGNTDDGDSSTTWGKVQAKTSLGSNFALLFQQSTDGSRTRWFVTRGTESGEIEAIQASGETTVVSADASLDEVPHYESENAAREAYQTWADANGDDADAPEPDDSTEWSKWRKVREANPWFIFGRSSTDGERVQFVVSGVADGTEVYLASDGSVTDTPHLFESFEAVQQALSAFSTAEANGEIPDGLMPNGSSPSTESVTKAVRTSSTQSTTNTTEKITEKLAGKPVLLAAVGVAGLAVLRQQGEQ